MCVVLANQKKENILNNIIIHSKELCCIESMTIHIESVNQF